MQEKIFFGRCSHEPERGGGEKGGETKSRGGKLRRLERKRNKVYPAVALKPYLGKNFRDGKNILSGEGRGGVLKEKSHMFDEFENSCAREVKKTEKLEDFSPGKEMDLQKGGGTRKHQFSWRG